jgi:diguanylate cyclase (GGDEF)-like protein/PAS domain S-box-containing protein
MQYIDVRTVVIGYLITNLICLTVIGAEWRQSRSRYEGIGFWLADYAAQFAALAALSFRGPIPVNLSVLITNPLVVGGTVLLLAGMERYIGIRRPVRGKALFFAGYFALHACSSLLWPSLLARDILLSAALLAVCGRIALLLLRGAPADLRPTTRAVGWTMLAFAAVSAARIAVELPGPRIEDAFKLTSSVALLLLLYQMMYIILTFALILAVNQRLRLEQEREMKARESAEEARRVTEEKFSKAFQSSPDVILISRLADGRFLEVNDSFCRLMGYTRDEALAGDSRTLNIWADSAAREGLVRKIKENGRIKNEEIDFRSKSGTILKGLYSGELIAVGGEDCLLSVVRDVTDLKRVEAIVRLRLELWEYAAGHHSQDLMRKALDGIEGLTDSCIGFYHLVDSEEVLSLQAWSTRTLAEYCHTEGAGMQYPLERAGVWADSIRLLAPVIHNDYPSLADRKGLPPGHAELVRELVVPVIRDGKAVAILGVGNKATPYVQTDVDMVSYIADVTWTIVDRKQTEERIRELNGRLERLAMTDELTGLANRRAFFLKGIDEIKKAKRYGLPLAFLMVDLDKFKRVNDTFGHEAGDAVLTAFARTVSATIREVDVAARIGGEEFGLLLPNTDGGAALMLAERLREAAERELATVENRPIGMTVSIGVSTFSDAVSGLDHLMKTADAALYEAKEGGRNRVSFSAGGENHG